MKAKTILRWIAVLPASIIGLFLGYAINAIIINYVLSVFIKSPDGPGIPGIIVTILSSGLSGFWYVVYGAYVAPSYKFITSLVLTVIMAIFSTISIMLNIMQGGTWITSLGIIVTLIATLATCIALYIDRDEFEESN